MQMLLEQLHWLVRFNLQRSLVQACAVIQKNAKAIAFFQMTALFCTRLRCHIGFLQANAIVLATIALACTG